MFRIGRAWDRITLDNAILIDEVERLGAELASRERALIQNPSVPVRSITIEVDNAIPEHVRLQVESEGRDVLHHLLGEEVDTLNPTLIEKALHRTVRVGKEEYIISPVTILLGSKIIARLRVIEGRVDVSP